MINPDSRNDSLEGLLQELSEFVLKRCEATLPCIVTKVSSDRKRVSVRPLIRLIAQDGSATSRSIIESLPVYQAGAGGFLMSFNVTAGDIGWIESSDRDISLFLQSYAEADPPTRRKHSFSDAHFVPDIMTNYTIASEDAGAVVIQNRAGTVKIAMDENQIRVVNGSTRFEINASSVTGTATDGFTLNGARITPDGDVVTAAGVSLNNHYHEQEPDSAGNAQEDTSPAVATE